MKSFAHLCRLIIILLVLSLPTALQAWLKLPPSLWPVLIISAVVLGYLFYRYLYQQTLCLINQQDLKQNLQLMQLDLDKKKLQQQLDILENLVARDLQTGLWNKSYCHDRLQEELKRAQRYQGTFSVLILDIDNFKSINDNLGHQAGDQYLMAFAKLLEINTRISDIICRYGGDEFLIILSDTSGEKATATAEKICQLASQIHLYPDYPLAISVGICDHGESYTSVEEIIYAADMALYEAKNAGRNQVKKAAPRVK